MTTAHVNVTNTTGSENSLLHLFSRDDVCALILKCVTDI